MKAFFGPPIPNLARRTGPLILVALALGIIALADATNTRHPGLVGAPFLLDLVIEE